MSIVDKYLRLRPNEIVSNRSVNISTVVPNPSDRDYRRGFIERHFVRRSNDPNGVIFEVDSSERSRIQSKSDYVTTTIDWRIIGTLEQVKESNRKSLRLGKRDISNLPMYLPNHKQFARIREEIPREPLTIDSFVSDIVSGSSTITEPTTSRQTTLTGFWNDDEIWIDGNTAATIS